jgi:hypothetical protein
LENILNEIVAILITGDIDQWYAWTIWTTLANTVEVSAQKFDSTDLEALLDNLGSKLIHAILGSVANNMVDGAATIGWSAVLANVLDAPIAKLTMSNDVDAGKNLLNA